MHPTHVDDPTFPDYFTLPIDSRRYSLEASSPSPSPWYDCFSPSATPTLANPHSSLPASKPIPMASPGADVSRLLQLQTQAAYRPSTKPLQTPSTGSSPTNSDSSVTSTRSNSSTPPSTLCCCRCRREYGHSGMFQYGTNLYYCSHCARMVGYSAG